MNDPELIQQAYADLIRQLHAVFHEYSVTAADPAAVQAAEQNFVRGVTLARRSRDRAIALLP